LKRIVIAGYYGFGNAGDEAILAAMLADLRRLRGDLRFTVTSADPAATAARFGVEAILWTDVAALAAAVRTSALVLVGGGGLFHDQGRFTPGALLTPQHSGIAFYVAPALLAALAGVPSMLYAVGVGPFRSAEAREFTRAAADLAAAITVRDPESRDALAALGVPDGRIEVTADPVYGFPATPPRPAVPPRLGVALRAWGGAGAAWEREAARGIDAFLGDTAAAAVFFPFQRLPGTDVDDQDVAERVRSDLACRDRASVWPGPADPAALRDALAECRLVLGMRLHSLILAQRCGVPSVALAYDPKVGAAMRLAGREAFLLELPALRGEALAAALRRAWQGTPAPLAPELESRARRTAAVAASLLEGAPPAGIWTPAARQLLDRAVAAQVETGHVLRQECERLFGEFEFYHRRSEQEARAAAAAADRARDAEAERSRLAQELAVTEAGRSRLAQELAAAEAAKSVLEHELAAAEAERTRLAQEVAAADAGRSRVEQELAAAGAERSRLAAELRAAGIRAAALESEVAALRAEQEAVLRGLDRFSRRLAGDLDVYRSQRAWKAMLLLRQGYTLWRERGLAPLLGRAFSLPFRGAGPLDPYDLRFPDVWDYLPAAFHRAPAGPRAADAPPPVEARYDIVVLPVFDFEFRFQRPQQLAAEFARRGHRVFWVSPARCLPPDGSESFRLVPLRDRLWEVQLRGTPPDLYGGGPDPERAAHTAAMLGALYRDQHIAASAVFVQFPYWAETALRLRAESGARILYDCMDDWRNWTAEPRISAFNLAEEQRLAAACDVLSASSRELQERELAAGRQALLVRNGADFAAFSSPRPGDVLADVPRPVIGYYGAIANWFDLELLEAAAAARPGYSFVLIGQVHQVDVSRLARLPNVRFLGEKNYRDLPRYLAGFDVCLIPFRVNRLTRAVDPVKLYEYLSQGKPVVATAMGELPPDPDLVVTAGSREEFLAALDRGVAERDDPEAGGRRARRIAYAQANTWSARADILEDALRDAFPLVSILIVTYNCEEFLGPCLDSIVRNSAWPNYEVIVLDNRSTDATAAVAERHAAADPRIHFIAHPENAGFAGGNNRAAAAARGEFLVFLNPDTIVTPGWIHRLVRHFAAEPKLGALAAVTNFSGNETKIDFRYSNAAEMERFALELAGSRRGERREVPVAPLYAVMVPRNVWEQVGELDAGYQVGMFEDDDFSVRVRRAGFRVAAAEDCFIHHFGNGSFGKLPQGEALRVFEANRRRFEDKWGTPWRPHTLRPGVRPLDAEVRFEPAAFVAGGAGAAPAAGAPPALLRLHPPRIIAGQGFNVQPDGRSAIVAECEHATPNTVIQFGGQPLATSFGGTTLLSALVPEELFAEPGRRAVRLVNDFGESPETAIEIAPPGGD
jgi:polysaccharide pyruvyl transferase CsaB